MANEQSLRPLSMGNGREIKNSRHNVGEKITVIELFSGFECISNAFRKRGHKCFTVDWDKRFNSDLHKDIGELTINDIPEEFRQADVIFLGTDCTTYSVAAISKHRRKNPITGNLDAISDKAKRADEINLHCKELIRQINPKIQIWENPMGAFRKMTFNHRKQTDFLSNINLHLKEPCKNGASCHEKAPRGAKTGLQKIKDPALKSLYPKELCEHIVDECEKYIMGNIDGK